MPKSSLIVKRAHDKILRKRKITKRGAPLSGSLPASGEREEDPRLYIAPHILSTMQLGKTKNFVMRLRPFSSFLLLALRRLRSLRGPPQRRTNLLKAIRECNTAAVRCGPPRSWR
jgi:hypothetical protein